MMLNWTPIGRAIEARLSEVLQAWDGTPYLIGQQARGVGVDCVRFVCAVLDELAGTPPVAVETLPQDAAMHTRSGAIATMKLIVKRYEPNERVTDGTIEPGDILVASAPGGGPGHAMIAGARRNVLWESSGDGVRRVGLGYLLAGTGPWKLEHVYRPRNKETWVPKDRPESDQPKHPKKSGA